MLYVGVCDDSLRIFTKSYTVWEVRRKHTHAITHQGRSSQNLAFFVTELFQADQASVVQSNTGNIDESADSTAKEMKVCVAPDKGSCEAKGVLAVQNPILITGSHKTIIQTHTLNTLHLFCSDSVIITKSAT